MTSTTKKKSINLNSIDDVNKLKTTVEMYRDLSDFERSLKEDVDRKKKSIVKDIEDMGSVYLDEINKKNALKENERLNMVDYIITNTKEKLVRVKNLNNMSYDEVKNIYIRAKHTKKSWFRMLIEFTMGW